MKTLMIWIFFSMLFYGTSLSCQQSVARKWNEILLDGIRGDFARPTVHARNLFHVSVAMYDAWAAYDSKADPYFLGASIGDVGCPFEGITIPTGEEMRKQNQEEAMSYAVMRMLNSRFSNSPGYGNLTTEIEALMLELGYDPGHASVDYISDNSPASLGNYIAKCLINFGYQDGSNELQAYENQYYQSFNPPLIVELPGNPDIIDPNKWQKLTLDVFIDQAGNIIPLNTPEFLGPEWGNVVPFALTDDEMVIYQRDGHDYKVYDDPGSPPLIEFNGEVYLPDEYKWGFSLVAVWSAQLDPSDGIMWDISPGSIGNFSSLPNEFPSYRNFYNLLDGGDPSQGWSINPRTGQPYDVQMVPRGDYGRVLAEFWADGPDSETPPGHWFTILNTVNEHPEFVRKFQGVGAVLDPLEWDVKAYFILGGAVHDAAVSTWSIKGWYDYIRPVSAIRYMADRGQSSDPDDVSYHINGIPLIDGFIELVSPGDSLAMISPFNIGKIKLYAWRGPDFINDSDSDVAGVGWILAENWWPYQRPSFVTPPFAGYISGHSTFSRAAAEVMTLLTGDEFFPGGMGEFEIVKNEFLVFEDGPSVDMTLQWATYRDASDQTSLSRIWGGIHPPADDIPGRLNGIKIGLAAFAKASSYFGTTTSTIDYEQLTDEILVYPNPIGLEYRLFLKNRGGNYTFSTAQIHDMQGRLIKSTSIHLEEKNDFSTIDISQLDSGIYSIKLLGSGHLQISMFVVNR